LQLFAHPGLREQLETEMKAGTVRIRPAARDDFTLLEILHKAAFTKCEFGYNDEALLARQLHEEGDALVSLIAEVDSEAVGHVMFSRMKVEADGKPVIAAGLAPIGIIPEWQFKGVGSLLIKAGLAALKPQGVQLGFVVGHPNYYPRFGFSLELAKPFASPFAGGYFMAVQLDDTLKMPTSGKAEFASAFARF
jgi:putative acetyltransferase